jgi:type IV pilus assembly protein PilM
MALANRFFSLLADPLPEYAFEISEAGIAWARPASPQPAFQPLEPGTVVVSPLTDNVHRADALADKVRAITGGASMKRRGAALILPDYSARVAVLEFDNFPTDPKEQSSLVRFRMKKSVPFDVESAPLSYYAQSTKSGTKSIDVVVVVAALEIVARYEAALRAANLHPGLVTTSLITMAELNPYPDVSILARLCGKTLTVAVMNGPNIKLVRCVEVPETTTDEILTMLLPTIAYVEDEMGSRPSRLLICGFGDNRDWQSQIDVPIEQMQSSFGVPDQFTAGLLGYLQSIGASTANLSKTVSPAA